MATLRRRTRTRLLWIGLVAGLTLGGCTAAAHSQPRLQSRAHGVRQPVVVTSIRIMDGDTAEIRWGGAARETVRVLGIDTAELFERGHRGGPPTAAGAEARGFARGAFAAAHRVELLRAAGLDRYGRTLGYFFIDGRNYSVLVLNAGLAHETITRFGDNGLAPEAAEVTAAAKRGGRSPG